MTGHEPLDETSQRSKLWLRSGSEAHKAIVKTVKDKPGSSDKVHPHNNIRGMFKYRSLTKGFMFI